MKMHMDSLKVLVTESYYLNVTHNDSKVMNLQIGEIRTF